MPAKTKAKDEAPRREQEAAKERKLDVGFGAKKRAASERARPAPADEGADGFAERADDLPAAPEPVALEESTGAFASLALDDEADASDGEGGAGGEPLRHGEALPGRVVLHRDGTLVVEIDVRSPLVWQPPASLVAHTADGESVMVTLAAGTTVAARLEPGMRLRLVLEVPVGMPVPSRLELEVDGRLLTIAPIV